MATFANRSRYYVKVKGREDLTREFPYNAVEQVTAYRDAQRAQGFKPTVGQHEDCILVRVRTKGFKPQQYTARSVREAQGIAAKIREERTRGLFIDYTKSQRVTLAELIARYIREECPKHKGAEPEAYRLNAFLADSGHAPVPLRAKSGAPRDTQGVNRGTPTRKTGRNRPRHEALSNLEFLDKPFAQLEPEDFETYIRDRLDDVLPASVDRELDLLSAVCNVAIGAWRYNVPQRPMEGVRRPKYFNERERRLADGEEARLIEHAREEDRLRSVALELERLMAPFREKAAALGSASARKRSLAAARAQLLMLPRECHTHVPLYETLIRFLLGSAARRSEALNLTWARLDFDARTAYFPETKNGRPRTVPLIRPVLAALEALPRHGERVFPISVDELKNAWERIRARAELHDLHIHDLRHEALSRIADTGKFTLVDLQAISGHRDPRMLLRYAHLCARLLAERLDKAFAQESTHNHKGRKRLSKEAPVSMGQLMRETSSADRAAELLRQALDELECVDTTMKGVLQREAAAAQVSDEGAVSSNVVKFAPQRRVG